MNKKLVIISAGVLLFAAFISPVAGTTKIEKSGMYTAGGPDNWPMLGHDPAHTGYSPSFGPETNATLFMQQREGQIQNTEVVVFNGKAYFAMNSGGNGILYGIDAYTGEILFDRRFSDTIRSGPATDGTNVYFTTNKLIAVHPKNGVQKWTYDIGSTTVSSPTPADGKIYVGSRNGKMHCIDSDGKKVWDFTVGRFIDSTPAVAGGNVYFGSWDRKVYCLDATNGHMKWNYTTGAIIKYAAAVENNTVYIGSYDGKMYCLNASTKQLLWTFPAEGNPGNPIVHDGQLYFGTDKKKFYCLDAGTGAELWNVTTAYPILSTPAVADGKVYFGSGPTVYCLDIIDGKRVWSYTSQEQTDDWFTSGFAIYDDIVYALGSRTNIYAFGLYQPKPELVIESITGGLGVHAVIRNIGDEGCPNVQVNITINGGFVFMRYTLQQISLDADESETISALVFGIGLGVIKTDLPKITVTVCASGLDPVEKIVTVKVIGPLVFVQWG